MSRSIQTITDLGLSGSVSDAIRKNKEGASKDYDIICSHLMRPDATDKAIIVILKGLKECVTLLGKQSEGLVGVLFKLNWLKRGDGVIKEYQGLIVLLVSANTVYLKPCCHMVVSSFVPRHNCLSGGAVISSEQMQADDKIFLELHKLLRKIVRTFPMSPPILVQVFGECFPFLTREAYSIECFAKNLFHAISYIEKSRWKILELLVDKITWLDVRAPRDELHVAEDDSEDEDDMEQDIFDMDEFLSGCAISKGPEQEEVGVSPMTHNEASRLDSLMELAFLYIQKICYPGGKLDWEATKVLYKELLLIFDRQILPTHASSHVQFLMFYIISFHSALVDGFIDYLWKKLQDPNTQPIFRQAAVAYLGSLVSRAKYIDVLIVKPVIEMLISWIHRYLTHVASSPNCHVSVAHHGPFYSTCQAAFYVFAFRHKDLLAMPKGLEFCQSLNFQTIVTSRLNPLKICLPIVAKTFSSIARCHQLAFCDTILERNKRQQLPVADSGECSYALHTHLNPLDSFFPFDPYLLSRSGKFITPLYLEFEGTPVHGDEEDSGSEGNDLMEAKAVDDDQFAVTPSSSVGLGRTPVDFMMYGVSPGFKNV